MKVGTTPLTIQVPEMAPIRNRITMAVVMSPTLDLMASSKSFQGVLYSHMLSHTQMPAANSRETCDAPRMESDPKMLISNANSPTSTRTGTAAMSVFA